MGTSVRMLIHDYRLVTYDKVQPWVALRTEHRTVDLPEGESFAASAAREDPAAWFRVIEESAAARG